MNKDGGSKGFGAGGSALWPKQSNPAPIEADKDLDELVRDACSVVPVPKSEYRQRLLAWRDKHTKNAYDIGYSDGFTAKNKSLWAAPKSNVGDKNE